VGIVQLSYAEARAPRGGVTRQGVVLNDLQSLLDFKKTSLSHSLSHSLSLSHSHSLPPSHSLSLSLSLCLSLCWYSSVMMKRGKLKVFLEIWVRVGAHAILARRRIHLDALLVDINLFGCLVLGDGHRHSASIEQWRDRLQTVRREEGSRQSGRERKGSD